MLQLIPDKIIRIPLWTPPKFRVSHVGALRTGTEPGTVEMLMTLLQLNARKIPVHVHTGTAVWALKALEEAHAEFGMVLKEFARTHTMYAAH